MNTDYAHGMSSRAIFIELVDMGVEPGLIYRATRMGGTALKNLYNDVMEDCANA